jgi:uncharacterized protein YggE
MNRGKLLIAGLVVVLAISLTLGGLALARTSDNGDTKIVLTGGKDSSTSEEYSALQLVNGQQTELTVTGTGKVTVKPDIAVVNLGVQVKDDTVSAAQETAKTAMSAILTSLSNNSIAEKDIKTIEFSIQPVWESNYNSSYYPGSQSVMTGYQVRNMLNITIRDTTKVGAIIDAAAKAAGDPIRVENIYFTIENPDSIYDQARKLAVKDAMAKAQNMADLAGVKLGSITSISENMNYYYGGYGIPPAIPTVYANESSVTTPIVSGESDITTSVQIVYTIE